MTGVEKIFNRESGEWFFIFKKGDHSFLIESTHFLNSFYESEKGVCGGDFSTSDYIKHAENLIEISQGK